MLSYYDIKTLTNLKIKNSLRDLWGNIKGKNIPILGVSERWREKKTDIQGQGNVIKRNVSQSTGNKWRFKTTTQKVGAGERELLTYI